MARLAFGGFELDPGTGDLRREGENLRIQEQPLRLLLCLMEHPGELVSREELHKRIWEEGVHVDFEDGLNAAAWRLRQVLGDSPEHPRFIETVPRKGYRFVGRVQPVLGKPVAPLDSFPMPVIRPVSGPSLQPVPPPRTRSPWKVGLGVGAGAALLGAGVLLWGALRPRPVPMVITPLANLTGDAAVDYFASAVTRQVTQDLAHQRGLSVHARGPGEGIPQDALALTWTLARTAEGYRITASLTDLRGRQRGDQVFLVAAENLDEVHRPIAGFVAAQATRPSPSPVP